MHRILHRGLCCVVVLRLRYIQTVKTNYFHSLYLSTYVMPPKRKAATAKNELADLAAGGDHAEPQAPKRGRAKKESEIKDPVSEENEKKGRTRKPPKEKEELENVEEQKKSKKPVPAKGNSKEKEAPEKKRGGRGKKAAELEEEIAEDDMEEKITTRKGNKKNEEANGETKEKDIMKKKTAEMEDEIPEEDVEEKITKRKGGKKNEDTNGVTKEKGTRKKKAEASGEEPKAKGRHKADKEEKPGPSNSTVTKWGNINFTCTKKNAKGQKANLKISCWNIGGLKSWVKKDCMQYLEYEDPDIFCLQETKCSEEKLPEEIKNLKDYKQYWCSSDKEGYAGVGLLTKREPLKVTYGINEPDQDGDGRCITAEFPEFYLVCVYVPNAGRKLVTLPKRLEWNAAFKDYIKSLDDEKPVIICGDMNVAHNEIDIARPSNNTKNAGFTKEEREGMTDFLQDGYVDTFRKLYPDKSDVYTFWTYMANARSKNIGWRLDYFIVSERIMDKVCDNVIRSEILGSDHCPFTLFINI